MRAFRPILVPVVLGLALGSVARAESEARREASVPPLGRVQGRVLDAAGWPLPGARIYAMRGPDADSGAAEARPVVETSSDAEGRFALEALEPGSYQIDIEAPDHQATHVGVHLPERPVPMPPLEVHLWPVTTRAASSPAAAAIHPEPSAPSAEPDVAAAEPESQPDLAASGPESTRPGGLAFEVMQTLEAGRVRQARALLERVEGLAAEDADLFYAVGEALLRAGQTAQAVTVLDGALGRDPGHSEARYRRALGLLGLGRLEDARAEFERVLELRSEGPLAEGARTALAELEATR